MPSPVLLLHTDMSTAETAVVPDDFDIAQALTALSGAGAAGVTKPHEVSPEAKHKKSPGLQSSDQSSKLLLPPPSPPSKASTNNVDVEARMKLLERVSSAHSREQKLLEAENGVGLGKNRNKFPNMLRQMLKYATQEGAKYSSGKYAIAWSIDGTAIEILDKKLFTESVLPLFFKRTQYSSFVRKLFRWGFQRVKSDDIKRERKEVFVNPHFLRDAEYPQNLVRPTCSANNKPQQKASSSRSKQKAIRRQKKATSPPAILPNLPHPLATTSVTANDPRFDNINELLGLKEQIALEKQRLLEESMTQNELASIRRQLEHHSEGAATAATAATAVTQRKPLLANVHSWSTPVTSLPPTSSRPTSTMTQEVEFLRPDTLKKALASAPFLAPAPASLARSPAEVLKAAYKCRGEAALPPAAPLPAPLSGGQIMGLPLMRPTLASIFAGTDQCEQSILDAAVDVLRRSP